MVRVWCHIQRKVLPRRQEDTQRGQRKGREQKRSSERNMSRTEELMTKCFLGLFFSPEEHRTETLIRGQAAGVIMAFKLF